MSAAHDGWNDMPVHFHFGPTDVDADAPIRDVALAVLRRQFAAMLAREPGVRLGEDTEELHDMRVASRRLRAALSLFEEALPATVTGLGGELAWVGRTLGAVRDLDVQMEQLDRASLEAPESERVALVPLRSLLADHQAVVRIRMLDALDSRRYGLFVGRFGRTLSTRHESSSELAGRPALAVAPDLIENGFRRLRKAANRIGPGSPPSEYHRLRARGKRIRYTLEFVGDLYPGHTQPLVKALTSLQDILGLHQDADVAIQRLRRLAVEHETLPPQTIFAMGQLAGRYGQTMNDLRTRFPRAYRQVSPRWRTFRQAIEADRPAPIAQPPVGAPTEAQGR